MSEPDKRLRDHLAVAHERLREVENDATKLPEPYRTLVLVEAAQGVIDNGGLIYFFESDWPGCPPYSAFSDAYRRIGMSEAADDLDNAAQSLDLKNQRSFLNAGWNS